MGMKASREVTSDEAYAFHRDGAVLLKSILPMDWVGLLAEGIDYANENPDGMSSLGHSPLRIDQFPADRSPRLKDVINESPIAEIVVSALDGKVRFYMDQMFVKPAGEIMPTPWHQDTCYYNVEGHDLVRAWVCVDPVPRGASLEVVRGSHLWNVTYRPAVGKTPDMDPEGAKIALERFEAGLPVIGPESHESWSYADAFLDETLPPIPDIAGSKDSYDILGWDYEPGDVILFHGHILHGAAGGIDLPHSRRAHASMWAGPDVRYVHRLGQVVPDPSDLYELSPKTGQYLEEFPSVFPVAWAP